MFSLKIHTVDFPQPLPTAVKTSKDDDNLKPSQLMGVAHLFRQLPSAASPVVATVADITARTTLLFVVAVPNYMTEDEFMVFCGNHVPHFVEILFLRNDAVEDRYSVLIRLESQLAADGFYCNYNGKRFRPPEVEVCHIYFAQSVKYSDSAEIASMAPADYTALPSCPVCLERLDPDTSGIRSTLCDHSFQCSCISKWTLSCPVCRLCQQQDEKPICAVCGTNKNLWICLICGFVGCGRYEKGHASGHWRDKQHHFSLELEKQQIWDYVGDRYVHRLNQSKVNGKSNIVNSHCGSVEECETCGYEEVDEGLHGALFSSKIEGVLGEYNRLLASQLDTQRQYYESLLAEAKSGSDASIKKAVEKAIFSMTHDMQDKLEKYSEEKKAVADKNQELMKKQDVLQSKYKEIAERERSLLKSKDDRILDLEEQIRDLKVFVEAQKMLNKTDPDGIRGGTVLPVESKSSSGNSKRRSKAGRRRN